MPMSSLLSLPRDILVALPQYLHNIEDFVNLSSTCRKLRWCLQCVDPNLILRLAAAQTNVFFRPSPYFFLAMTARELGDWARKDPRNEALLASTLRLKERHNIESLYSLVLDHCGLTLERIRHFHRLRFHVFNPVIDLMCRCVGRSWLHWRKPLTSLEQEVLDDEVSFAGTRDAAADETLFRLSIYADLFGPDLFSLHDTHPLKPCRTLSADTRMQYILNYTPRLFSRRREPHEPRGHADEPDGWVVTNPNVALQ